MKNNSIITVTVVLLIVGAGVFGYYLRGIPKPTTPSTPTPTLSEQPLPTEEPRGIACTMDAKVCPDGSAVGRIPPKCEFAPCPGQTSPKTPLQNSCVDFMGNPQSDDACAGIPPEGRTCSTTSDCTPTCSKGCVSRTWISRAAMADCEAVPQYTCSCIESICTKTK